VRIEHGQPIRSAITVAGIVGNACNNSRIRGSYPSTTDPAGAREYRGGPSLAKARFTVFREIPTTRAISEIDNASARRSRRTSAQSSTPNTRFLPGSTPGQGLGEAGQSSVAALWSVLGCRRQRAAPSAARQYQKRRGQALQLFDNFDRDAAAYDRRPTTDESSSPSTLTEWAS
jgi:hypothetical protein